MDVARLVIDGEAGLGDTYEEAAHKVDAVRKHDAGRDVGSQ